MADDIRAPAGSPTSRSPSLISSFPRIEGMGKFTQTVGGGDLSKRFRRDTPTAAIALRPQQDAEAARNREVHVDKLRETKAWDDAKREEFCSNYRCIYVYEITYDCSLMAVGCTVSLAEAIARGEVRNGMALVMAGTGDLQVLRMCRHLHERVGPSHPSATYGAHMAVHMALGLLFLGGGTQTLVTHHRGIAGLLTAFFPKFPTHSSDNRYHLQALRHLYVLAVEPRLVIPCDTRTLQPCYTHLRVLYLDTPWYSNEELTIRAPCLLPPLDTIYKVEVKDSRYWPIVFEKGKNWDTLLTLLKKGGQLPVTQKAGSLSYMEDPLGFKSMLGRLLSSSDVVPWDVHPVAVESFTSDPTLLAIAQSFRPASELQSEEDNEAMLLRYIGSLMYECITHEKQDLITFWPSMVLSSKRVVFSQWVTHLQLLSSWAEKTPKSILTSEAVMSLILKVKSYLTSDIAKTMLKKGLRQYMLMDEKPSDLDKESKEALAAYLTWEGIPPIGKWTSKEEVGKELQKAGVAMWTVICTLQFMSS
ncbi:unnamed protein product [Darwinula stevensoni]|uniref:Anaphase-promoting complex subunit 1 n=1 Tax=Darwinula stevensoni TaxID=69355 RepID=A0A7R8XJ24_9CRUS|nr:unnamed protein product [Darwinula stevensoni]CAG0891814.1 unnamed protein product [Darwinula stevensoni]